MKTQLTESQFLVTLVGPPNSGKTTLFNYLSGKNYKTVNYPGSTVEYSTCKILGRFGLDSDLLDSPGIVSLKPNSPDEKVAVDSIYHHPKFGTPDILIATVDASQITRHLLLVKELLDAGFNVIVAVTMLDILQKKGADISLESLSAGLGCKVFKIDGRSGSGADDLIREVKIQLINNSTSTKANIVNIDFDNEYLLGTYRFIEELKKTIIVDFVGVGEGISKTDVKNKNGRAADFLPDGFTMLLDKYLLDKYWGLIFFFFIMAFTFTSIFWAALPLMDLIDNSFGYAAGEVKDWLGVSWYSDLIADGIITGTGSVLVFLPQILILFLILGFLEDTGYLARGAMLIDRPLSKIGLNGRSFVPMLSGFACAIPAILAARTIPNRRERLLTIFIIPLMSCSARLPVYALLIAYLFPRDSMWLGGVVLAVIYIFSILSSIIAAAIINNFNKGLIREEDNSSFILELPAYRMPKLNFILRNTLDSSKVYMKKAGPIILFFSLTIWVLTYFPDYNPNVNLENVHDDEIEQIINSTRLSNSYAADLGKLIQPVMTPIGMDWRVGVSLIAAFTAREVFVSSLALIFKVTGEEEALQSSILSAMKQATIAETGEKLFTTATIVGLIVFFVFALQCLSTVAMSRKETGGWRIPILQIIIFTSTAYVATFFVVNGLRFLGIN